VSPAPYHRTVAFPPALLPPIHSYAATPAEGQQIPKVLLGFNNWKVKLDPQEMKHSSIQVRGKRLCVLAAGGGGH
jgi:hypothetical protein